MTIEVALIQTDPDRRVKLLGRSGDADLVEIVRDRLGAELETAGTGGAPVLRIVTPLPGSEGTSSREVLGGTEGTNDTPESGAEGASE